MTPTAAAQAPQSSRVGGFKSTVRPIIPVIPLHYLKKQQQKKPAFTATTTITTNTTTTTLKENIHPHPKEVSAPEISRPSATFLSSPPSVIGSTNGNGILSNDSEATEETPTTATSPVSESNSDNQEAVEEVQKSGKEQIEGKPIPHHHHKFFAILIFK